MDPDWMERARTGQTGQIQGALRASTFDAIALPAKLWAIIEAMPGRFQVEQDKALARFSENA
jgi:hypothetical protein